MKGASANKIISEPSFRVDNAVVSARRFKIRMCIASFVVFSLILILLKILVASKVLEGLEILSFDFQVFFFYTHFSFSGEGTKRLGLFCVGLDMMMT